ncbi:uncharacterized protein BDZ99DRAFT_473806 [Mytilinidion resinicola]|uniref:Uncharacterized protein n=1 Tax=Mytilinidion resinicola TaxID=574789 RepID=A0A6A6YYT0_9PEZI|nr:uncharacterized protein BDZ99DRAFT_473806 [Mytilinidion resinicola]KAF2813085.1 hypothetical protein BDZ99DRAFT_473806 [Mytilinidion resinicola]
MDSVKKGCRADRLRMPIVVRQYPQVGCDRSRQDYGMETENASRATTGSYAATTRGRLRPADCPEAGSWNSPAINTQAASGREFGVQHDQHSRLVASKSWLVCYWGPAFEGRTPRESDRCSPFLRTGWPPIELAANHRCQQLVHGFTDSMGQQQKRVVVEEEVLIRRYRSTDPGMSGAQAW